MMIFSTEGSLYFAQLMAKHLGISVTPTDRRVFGGGETYFRLGIEKRSEVFGKTAIVVGSTHTDAQIDELESVGCALAGYGAVRRIFVIPFFGYSTMERATLPGEIVRAKVVARRLSAIPNTGMGNTFLMMDLHAPGMVHYFEGDCLRYEVLAQGVLVEAIKTLGLERPKFASADLGRPQRVVEMAEAFGDREIALISKARRFEETEVLAVVGDVAGRDVLVCDDMTRSGGTLIKAAEAYLEKGASSVSVVLSHGAFNDENVVKGLVASPIKRIVMTNSHPASQLPLVKKSEKFVVVDVSKLFTDLIYLKLI